VRVLWITRQRCIRVGDPNVLDVSAGAPDRLKRLLDQMDQSERESRIVRMVAHASKLERGCWSNLYVENKIVLNEQRRGGERWQDSVNRTRQERSRICAGCGSGKSGKPGKRDVSLDSKNLKCRRRISI